jgi:sulfoxide reductase heme-binding subunit YedZ
MTVRSIRLLKVLLFLLCLVPLGILLLETFGLAGLSLGANPIEELIHSFGKWGLRFLLITLAVTPLRRLTGKGWLLRFRRMLGLFAFFYILMHFLTYAGLDQRFDLAAIIEDIAERPYITVGFTALLLLFPLALTSTNAMMKRLGRRWQKLHRLVYVIAILGVWHFYWQVKLDTLEPLIYALILAVLLGSRLTGKKHGRTAHA